MFSKMTKATAHIVEIAIVLGILILINILASDAHFRWDLTKDKEFTIHQSSRDVVANLPDELRVTLYTSTDLPAKIKGIRKDVLDIIEEYKASANSNFVFREEHPDPEDQQSAQALAMRGIQPVQATVVEKGRTEFAQVYLGLLVSFGTEDEAIQLDDLQGLEYRLTRAIMKLTAKDIPTIGVFAGAGMQPMSQDGGFSGLGAALRTQYDVMDVDLSRGDPVPDKVKTLIVISPASFGSKEKAVLDQFIMRGGKVVLLLDTIEIDLQQGGLQQRARRAPTPWADFIAHYGLKVDNKLVLDLQNSHNLPSNNPFVQIWYPLWPKVVQGYFGDLAFTSDIESFILPWASPVEALNDKLSADVTATSIFKTSEKTYTMDEPISLDPTPFQERNYKPPEGEPSQYDLGIILSGVFTSYFADREIPVVEDTEGVSVPAWQGEIIKTSVPTDIVLIGCSHAFSDMAIAPGRSSPNEIFLMNMVDSLNLGGGLSALRSRTVTDRPLKPDLTDGEKSLIRFSGIFLVPILLSLIGFGRFILRAQTRKLVEAKTAEVQ